MSAKGQAELIRQAGRTARRASGGAERGELGEWSFHFAISGLSEARRDELVEAMNAELPEELKSGQRPKKVGDGRFHFRGRVMARGLGSAVNEATARTQIFLRDAGLSAAEIADATAEADFEVVEDSEVLAEWRAKRPKGLRSALSRKLANLSHGLGVASSLMYEIDERQKNGDRNFEVAARVDGIDEQGAKAINDFVVENFGDSPRDLSDGSFWIDVKAEQVSGPLGALGLTARKLDQFFDHAGVARLRLFASPADSA